MKADLEYMQNEYLCLRERNQNLVGSEAKWKRHAELGGRSYEPETDEFCGRPGPFE
jgi:hypothetical protein